MQAAHPSAFPSHVLLPHRQPSRNRRKMLKISEIRGKCLANRHLPRFFVDDGPCRLAHPDGAELVQFIQYLIHQYLGTSWGTGNSLVLRMVRPKGEVSGITCGLILILGCTALARSHSHRHHFPRLCQYHIKRFFYPIIQ